MGRYKTGIAREQINIELLDFDSLIAENNAVRAIDAIVNRMDMVELGFVYGKTKETGRLPYKPSDMMKLYFYAYTNGISSSRKIERESSRNVEVMWLINRLAPDFKTIRSGGREQVQSVE